MTDEMTDEQPTPDRAEAAFRAAFIRGADRLEPAPLTIDHRRHGWPVIGAAAAALVLAAGIGGLALTGLDAGRPDKVGQATTPAFPGSDLPAPDAGWRWVSFHNIAAQVPESWDYAIGPDESGCGDGPKKPYVAEAGELLVTDLNLCVTGSGRSTSPMASFEPGPEDSWVPYVSFPEVTGPGDQFTVDGWTATTRGFGERGIRVLSDHTSDQIARRIIESARTFVVDQSGCQATSSVQAKHFQRPDHAFDVEKVSHVDDVSVCLYNRLGTSSPGLIASRSIDGASAAELLAAIQQAPVGGGPDLPDNCVHDAYGDTGLVVRLNDGEVSHDLYGYTNWCFGNGLDDGTNRRTLTVDDCTPLFAEKPVQLQAGDASTVDVCSPMGRLHR